MSDTPSGGHGRKLWDYLDTLRGTQTMRSFVLLNNIDYSSVMRWQTGDPSMDSLRQVADGLGRPLGEILIIAGYGDASDFGGIEARKAQPPSAAHAIDHDPTLSDHEREALRTVLALARNVAPAGGGSGKGGIRKITVQ